jgi:tetratricopeptide (TPR) repeat protein
MRKNIFSLLAITITSLSYSQDYHYIDSLKQVLKNEKEDTSKVLTLATLSGAFFFFKPDSQFFYADQGLQLAKKLDFERGQDNCYLGLMGSTWFMGNFAKAIEFETQRFRMHERKNDANALEFHNRIFTAIYRDQGDYKTALVYGNRMKKISDSLGIFNNLWIPGHLASVYVKINQLDSALLYAQKAYEIDLKSPVKSSWFPSLLGDVHSKLGNYELAIAYYRQAILLGLNENAKRSLIDTYNGISTVFNKIKQPDSTIFYSRKILETLNSSLFTQGNIEASINMTQAYKSKGQIDSTLKYLELNIALKDSLYSQEKIIQVQNLAFNEQKHQEEMDEKTLKEKAQRRYNLQYALIGIGLISFLILFFLLSHSIIVRTGLIKFLGIIALLLVFEFINLFMHPYLTKITNDSPLLMLLVLVCIAALLVPAHHRLEKWITHRLAEKNKKIRLAAAKKTIARLEGKETS